MKKKLMKSNKSEQQPRQTQAIAQVYPGFCPFRGFLHGWHTRPKAERTAEEDCALLLLAHILWASRSLADPGKTEIILAAEDLKELGISSESDCLAGLKTLRREGLITKCIILEKRGVATFRGRKLVWRAVPKPDRERVFEMSLPWLGASRKTR